MSFFVLAGSTCESLLQSLSVGLTKKGCFHNSNYQHSIFCKCKLMLVQGFVGGFISAAIRAEYSYKIYCMCCTCACEFWRPQLRIRHFGVAMVVLKAMIIVWQNSCDSKIVLIWFTKPTQSSLGDMSSAVVLCLCVAWTWQALGLWHGETHLCTCSWSNHVLMKVLGTAE